MVQLGLHYEGQPTYPLTKLESGWVVPDVTVSEMDEYHRELVHNEVELAVHAEELGYDYAFHTENHLNPTGIISPTPIQTQTAIAERTDDIRLVQMAVTPSWHHPIRLAERLSVLDLLSDGRIGVGIGSGFGRLEERIFDASNSKEETTDDEAAERFEEQYELLQKALGEELFSHHGAFYDYPPTEMEWEEELCYRYLENDVSGRDAEELIDQEGDRTLESLSISPGPARDTHPQFWRACASTDSIEWAAKRGVNVCTLGTDFDVLQQVVDLYYHTAQEAGWPDRRPKYDGEPFRYGWDEHRRRGVVAQTPVFNTEAATEEAFERWKLGVEFNMCKDRSKRATEEIGEIAVNWRDTLEDDEDAPIVGDTETIIDGLARLMETCGYEDLFLVPTFTSRGMTTKDRVEQLRSMAEDVKPYFEDLSE